MTWAEQALVERWQLLIALTPKARKDAIKTRERWKKGWAVSLGATALHIWTEIGMKYQDCARAGLTRDQLNIYPDTALAMELGR